MKGPENLTTFKPFEDVKGKVYPRPFSVRVPMDIGEKLIELSPKQRTLLLRRAIIAEVEKMQNNN
jgi:hypothetical protein